MNQRIRYQQLRPGVLVSRRNYTIQTGQTVIVELNLEAKKFRILDAVDGLEVASGGNTKNSSVLKIQAKRALVALGVQFSEEIRNRNGVVDEGST